MAVGAAVYSPASKQFSHLYSLISSAAVFFHKKFGNLEEEGTWKVTPCKPRKDYNRDRCYDF
jgi:hypothetical protein